MNHFATHYRTGEVIQAGDRITWAGSPGSVLFVLGATLVSAEYAGWIEQEITEGFMLDTEVAGHVFEPESNEDLEFLGRKIPAPELGERDARG
jgi:hypothetical protein